VIARLDEVQAVVVRERDGALDGPRRWHVRRNRTARLHELEALDVPTLRGRFATATNGTYVPDTLPFDESFWRVVGLYLAEGHISRDGQRDRIAWSFHPHAETDLVDFVHGYWSGLGVKADVRRVTTTMQVSISSRLLAAWFLHTLELGRSCYDHAIPPQAWSASPAHKRALLRGLWDGDGSWSLVNGGPSVVLQYGTVSRRLADGMLRLLGDLGIVARMRIGRTAKSTVPCHWITISGADQIEASLWLFPEQEQEEIRAAIAGQAKRISPTGYRRLSKNAAWVRVDRTESRPFRGTVYSVEVPGVHTVVTSGGLVCHQCLPKDTRALIHIAEDAGYDFDLLKGVVAVNDQQLDRVATKAAEMAGGSLDGKSVAVWGLTFKARTDDLRESPALAVIERLRAQGAAVRAFDPTVSTPLDPRRAIVLDGIEVVDDPYAACENADVLLVLTEWEEFRWLDFDKAGSALAKRRVLDARNLLDREALRRRGFEYQGIGRR
jgi:UDPglucose 6-dehydrogenase